MSRRYVYLILLLFVPSLLKAQSGVLDTTYNGNGVAMFPQTTAGSVTSVILQDGRTVTGGVTIYYSKIAFFLACITTNGTLDSSFGVNGFAYDSVPNTVDLNLYNMTLQPDGKILLVGTHDTVDGDLTGIMVRFFPTGVIDSSFGINGNATLASPDGLHPLITFAAKVQPDGHILGAGGYQRSFLLARFTSEGHLDSTYASRGIAQLAIGGAGSYGGAKDLIIQPDGKVVLTGAQYNSGFYFVAVIRYKTDGTIDSTFGINGATVTSVLGYYDDPNALLLQSDGKIVVAGTTNVAHGGITPDNAFMALRYDTAGILDPTFGTGGITVANFNVMNDFCGNAVLQPDDKLVLGGYVSAPAYNINFALVRLTTDGIPDTSFSANGFVTIDLSSPSNTRLDYGNHVNIQADGKLVLTGYSRLLSTPTITAMRFLSGLRLSASDLRKDMGRVIVYPNPLGATARLIFDSDETGSLSATLMDMTGSKVAELLHNAHCNKGANNLSLQIPADLAQGNYLIRITDENGRSAVIKVIR